MNESLSKWSSHSADHRVPTDPTPHGTLLGLGLTMLLAALSASIVTIAAPEPRLPTSR